MLPVHIQDLFGGNTIKYNDKLYTVTSISRNLRNTLRPAVTAGQYQYWRWSERIF